MYRIKYTRHQHWRTKIGLLHNNNNNNIESLLISMLEATTKINNKPMWICKGYPNEKRFHITMDSSFTQWPPYGSHITVGSVLGNMMYAFILEAKTARSKMIIFEYFLRSFVRPAGVTTSQNQFLLCWMQWISLTAFPSPTLNFTLWFSWEYPNILPAKMITVLFRWEMIVPIFGWEILAFYY